MGIDHSEFEHLNDPQTAQVVAVMRSEGMVATAQALLAGRANVTEQPRSNPQPAGRERRFTAIAG